ncbi:MAG: hypothetical protein DRJ40_10800 [Thermoprotei archaeon]|nr:MAG: hypothetical protein DRJ40_10800 [Thermoprotei archaeon]
MTKRKKDMEEPFTIKEVKEDEIIIEIKGYGEFKVRSDLERLSGIGPVTKKKLINLGIYTVRQLALFNDTELLELITRSNVCISEETILKALDQATSQYSNIVLTAKELKRYREVKHRIYAHDKIIDDVLQFATERTYCFTGEYGSGKTELCVHMAVSSQFKPKDGSQKLEFTDTKVIYLDTEGALGPKHLDKMQAIAARLLEVTELPQGTSKEEILDKVLSNILVIKCRQAYAFKQSLKRYIPPIIEAANVKLIIVDSIIRLFRAQYPGRRELSTRQQELGYCIDLLGRIAATYQTCVLMTNQIYTRPVTAPYSTVSEGSQKDMTGGSPVKHYVTEHWVIEKPHSKNEELEGYRYLIALDVPGERKGLAVKFRITDSGIVGIRVERK